MIRAIAISFALMASPALACSIPPKPAGWTDKPVRIGGDCSFKGAEETHYGYLKGNAPVDLGGGRIGQRWLHDSSPCTSGESLIVADCQSLEIVRVFGQPDPTSLEIAGVGHSTSVDYLYAPKGKIRLSQKTSVGQVASMAQRAGYQYQTNVTGFIARLQPRNRFDPFCGCKRFYPGSTGAR